MVAFVSFKGSPAYRTWRLEEQTIGVATPSLVKTCQIKTGDQQAGSEELHNTRNTTLAHTSTHAHTHTDTHTHTSGK